MSSKITDSLFSKGILIDLDIGRWVAVKKLQPTDVLLDSIDNRAMHLGHKRLMPDGAMANLQTVDLQARKFLELNSIPFPISGARFITYKTVPQTLIQLHKYKGDYELEVEKFLASYDSLKWEQIEVLNRQAESLYMQKLSSLSGNDREMKVKELEEWLSRQMREHISLYPSSYALKDKFNFSWRMFKIATLEGMTHLDAQAIADAQTKLKQDLEAWVQTTCLGIHQALGEAAQQAKSVLEKNGKLSPRNLKPLLQAFNTFTAVDFAGSAYQDLVERARKKFKTNDDGLIDFDSTAKDLTAEFNSILSELGALASDEMAREAANNSLLEFGRMVEV